MNAEMRSALIVAKPLMVVNCFAPPALKNGSPRVERRYKLLNRLEVKKMDRRIKELTYCLEIIQKSIECMDTKHDPEHNECLMNLDDAVVIIREVQLALLVTMV